jgi:hypothetical protein
MFVIRRVHVRLADRLQQLLAVVGELEDRVAIVVDEPHVLLGIVGTDIDRVRAPQHLVPLRPPLDDVAVAVDDEDAVLPLELDAVLADVGVVAHLAVHFERAGRAGDGRVAPEARDGKGEARSDLRHRRATPASRRWNDRQLAALDVIDAIRTLREDTLPGAERPLLVARQRAQILGPVGHHLIRAGRLEIADRCWRRRQGRSAASCLCLH